MEAPATAIKKQPFLYYAVLDFEATCDENKQTWKGPPEIIEFPSVVVCASTLRVVDEFHFYIKPEVNPLLTPFCTELTGIQQKTVDAGIPLAEALQRHKQWLHTKNLVRDDGTAINFALVTCGDWDLGTMLPSQCNRMKLARASYLKSFVNIKKIFQQFYKRDQLLGMAGMLQVLGLPLEGKHHSGIDDCRNLARILIHMIRAGAVLELTTVEPVAAAPAPPPPADNPLLVLAAEKFVKDHATRSEWQKYLDGQPAATESEPKKLLGMFAAHLWKAFSEANAVTVISKNDKKQITSLFSSAATDASKSSAE